jgi:acetyltransferase-like isoleucine patch superfamily enzyme
MIRMALDSPWRVLNEVRRWLAWPYIRLMFALYGIQWGRGWRIFGMPIVQRYRGSQILLGDGLELRSWYSTNPLAPCHPVVLATRSPSAIIRIGDHCGLTGATVVSVDRITIGNNVLIGANVTIVDTDFHPLDPRQRQEYDHGLHSPVVISDEVFIGMNSLVLKGVTIGRGSVVGAGSVVTHDVPPRAIVVGNPARVIRTIPDAS